jgi:hypothetical protein
VPRKIRQAEKCGTGTKLLRPIKLLLERLLLTGQGYRSEEQRLHDAERFPQDQGRDSFARQSLDPLLKLRHFLRVLADKVGLLSRVFRQVEELDNTLAPRAASEGIRGCARRPPDGRVAQPLTASAARRH